MQVQLSQLGVSMNHQKLHEAGMKQALQEVQVGKHTVDVQNKAKLFINNSIRFYLLTYKYYHMSTYWPEVPKSWWEVLFKL